MKARVARTVPPWPTTTARPPGWRAAIRRSAGTTRSASCSYVSPTPSRGLARARRVAPSGKRSSISGHVRPCQLADVDLAQLPQRDDLGVEPRREDLGRLARAGEVARVDGVDRLAGERVGELARLRATASR